MLSCMWSNTKILSAQSSVQNLVFFELHPLHLFTLNGNTRGVIDFFHWQKWSSYFAWHSDKSECTTWQKVFSRPSLCSESPSQMHPIIKESLRKWWSDPESSVEANGNNPSEEGFSLVLQTFPSPFQDTRTHWQQSPDCFVSLLISECSLLFWLEGEEQLHKKLSHIVNYAADQQNRELNPHTARPRHVRTFLLFDLISHTQRNTTWICHTNRSQRLVPGTVPALICYSSHDATQ